MLFLRPPAAPGAAGALHEDERRAAAQAERAAGAAEELGGEEGRHGGGPEGEEQGGGEAAGAAGQEQQQLPGTFCCRSAQSWGSCTWSKSGHCSSTVPDITVIPASYETMSPHEMFTLQSSKSHKETL